MDDEEDDDEEDDDAYGELEHGLVVFVGGLVFLDELAVGGHVLVSHFLCFS